MMFRRLQTQGDDPQITLSEMVDVLWDYAENQVGEITYQDVAIATGLSGSTVRKVRVGEQDNPNLRTLRGFATFFGVKLDYFNCLNREECQDYLAQVAKESLEQSLEEQKVKLRGALTQEGLSVIDSLTEMIEYVKEAENLKAELRHAGEKVCTDDVQKNE